MSDDEQPKRRGRPPKSSAGPKVGSLTFRTRADFRERLEQAAAQSGRSVTEEVELRVERSFEIDPIVRDYNNLMSVFIDNGENARKFATSAMAIISILQELKAKDGHQIGSEDWSNSVATRAGLRRGLTSLVDHYAPQLIDSERKKLSAEVLSDISRAESIAKLQAMIETGRISDVLDLVVRQDDATT
jgi:hypothetical protein